MKQLPESSRKPHPLSPFKAGLKKCHTFPREPSPIARKEPDCSPADLRNTPDLQQLRESKHQQWTKALQLPAAMLALSLFTLGLLSAVAPASCQQGLGKLQPWMQGLIAVAVFLVLVAIAFAVNHFWCQEEPEPGSTVMIVGSKADGVLVGMDGKYSSMAAGFRSSEHKNAFENVLEEEGRVRSTPM